MLRILIIAATAVALAGSAQGGLLDAGTVPNKFYVTYSIVPDLTHTTSLFIMPRNIKEAKKDKFTQVSANKVDKTTLWCRDGDFRVCVYLDQQGSVAGIQLSVRVNEIKKKNFPLDILAIPEWRQQTLLGEDVYSAVAYFQSRKELLAGGRVMTDTTHTAPNGLYLLQTDKNGVETGRLHVATSQSKAESSGFYEQACFNGMGKHYFQDLKKDRTCEAQRPFFLLFGPQSKELQGFGFGQYGTVSQQRRGWFEKVPAVIAKQIAPDSPDCMSKWIDKYGLFTMHVFFVDKPYFIRC